MADIKSGQDVTALMGGLKSGDDVTALMTAPAVAEAHPEARIGAPSPDAPVTLGDLQADPIAAIKRIGAIIGKDAADPKTWLTLAASYLAPKLFSAAAPVVGKAAAGAMRMAPEVVRGGATAAGAYMGGPAGAVVGRTIGESIAGRMTRPAPEPTGPVSLPGYPRAGTTPPPTVAAEPAPHLDLSTRVPASSLTPQQINERMAAARAQGMTAPQVEPVRSSRPAPSEVPPMSARQPVPDGPPAKSPQQMLNEEASARRRATVAAKPVEAVQPEPSISAEDAAAELQKRWGTPSDAERRFPPNKNGLPSNPPTARKARGKISDLADMPIEKPKPAGPTDEQIASVANATKKKFRGKIADLSEMGPAVEKYAKTQEVKNLSPELDYALKWIENDMEAIPYTKRTVIDHPDKGMGGARLGVGGSAGAKIYRNIVGEEGREISTAKRADVLTAIKNLRSGKVTPVGELVLGVAKDLAGMSVEKLQKLMATPPP